MSNTNILENVAMIVSLNITRYGGEKIDKKASEEICETNKADYDSGKFIKKLFQDNKALDATRKIASKARHESKKLTLPYKVGEDLLGIEMYEKHGNMMREFHNDFMMAVDVFCDEIKKDKERQKVNLGSLFNEDDYPDVDSIRSQFTFTVQYETISDCQNFDKLGLGKLIGDAMQIQNNRIDKAVMSMFKRIEKYLENFADKTEKYQPKTEGSRVKNEFRDTLITNLRDLCTNLPMMNITKNEKITELCEDINHLIKGLDIGTLRDDDVVRNNASKQAKDILAKMDGYCG